MNDEQLPEHERIVKEIQERIERQRNAMQSYSIGSIDYNSARNAAWVLLCLLDDLGYSL